MATTPNLTTLDTVVHTQITAPSVRIRRGGRTIYQLALKANDFGHIVPSVPSRFVGAAQRGFDEIHARRIAKFMLDNPDTWAFGPISLALTPKYMNFEAADGLEDNSVEYGTLTLHPGATEAMRILDGQHRRAALQMIRQRALPRRSDAEFDTAEAAIDASDLSVDLYEIGETADVRRVFNWMNAVKPVGGSERVLLDNTDPFNAAVQRITGSLTSQHQSDKIGWLAPLCIPLMNNEFRRVAQHVKQGTTYWLSATNLRHAMLARTAGRNRMTAADRKRLSAAQIVVDAKTMFNLEFPALRPEWESLQARAISGMQLPDLRERTMAFDPKVPLIAAWSLHLVHSSPIWEDGMEKLVEMWRSLDLGVENPTRLIAMNHRDEPVRPGVEGRFIRQSAANIVEAALSQGE